MATIKINYGGTTYSMVKTSSKITTPSIKIDNGWIPCFKGDRFAEITYGDRIYTLSPLMVNGYRMACGSKVLQKDVKKSLTGTLSATLTNTDSAATKTVTKRYSSYSSTNYSNALESGHIEPYDTDTFTYGVTFSSTPSVTTSNSTYYRVSSVTTTNTKIARYVYGDNYRGSGIPSPGPAYKYDVTAPAGTATATGQFISSKVVSKTVSKTVNYGVTYRDVPTISKVVGCTVSNIGTTACTVTTTLSTTLDPGQSKTLSSNFSFDVVGDAIISSKD